MYRGAYIQQYGACKIQGMLRSYPIYPKKHEIAVFVAVSQIYGYPLPKVRAKGTWSLWCAFGIPLVFLWYSFGIPLVIQGIPLVFLWYSLIFLSIPLVFLWYAYGIPIEFHWNSIGNH